MSSENTKFYFLVILDKARQLRNEIQHYRQRRHEADEGGDFSRKMAEVTRYIARLEESLNALYPDLVERKQEEDARFEEDHKHMKIRLFRQFALEYGIAIGEMSGDQMAASYSAMFPPPTKSRLNPYGQAPF